MTMPLDATQQSWLRASLARLRDKLIDLSKANPLVSFKHSERGASFLRVIDERPDVLFARLQAGHMSFEPLPAPDETPRDETTPRFRITWEKARLTDPDYLAAIAGLGEGEEDEAKVQAAERLLRARVRAELGLPVLDAGRTLDIAALARAHGFDPAYELAADPGDGVAADDEDHRSDSRIRVLLTADRLDARLRTIHDRYRGHAAETGLHTLFLAFGFVEWFEDEASRIPLHAPALVLPVHLERRIERSRHLFSLTARDEDLTVNVAARELLRQRLGIEMPALLADETPEAYFARLTDALAQAPRLRLALRRFVTLAVLPFPRMVLWQDLDPAVWPDGALEGHPLLPRLLGAADAEGGGGFMGDYEIDAPAFAPRVPPLVLDADVSQHSALIDVSEGKSLAIEGPPGTGKSQTIANMIATALDRGKRVLFVAEKQAALDVVAKRLEKIGLGPLLLQLHSDRATKTELLRALAGRIAIAAGTVDAAEIAARRAELADKKALLRRYLGLLREPLGALGRSAHQLVWRELALRERCAGFPEALGALPAAAPETIDPLQLKRTRDALDNVAAKAGEIAAAYGTMAEAPWVWARRLGAFDQSGELAAAGRAAQAGAAMMAAIGAAATRTGIASDDPLALAAALAGLPDPSGIADGPLAAALADPDGCRALVARHRKWAATDAAARRVHDTPLTPRADALAALDAASAGLPATLVTLADARLALDEARERCERLAGIAAAAAPVATYAGLAADGPLAGLAFAADAAARVAELDDAASALRSDRLLEDRAAATIAAARAAADGLDAEGEALAASIDLAQGLAADPARLEALAATIEEAGLAARLFGGAYKAAWREARRLFANEPERAEVAPVLRRLKRLIEARRDFADASPARRLFGEADWRGIASDWTAIAAAQACLSDLVDRADGPEGEALVERLAGEPARGLRRLGAAAGDVSARIAALGPLPAGAAIGAMGREAEARRAALDEFVAAAGRVGLRGDAPLRDGDAGPAAPIRRAQAAHAALAERPAGPLWTWTTGDAADADRAEAALALADALPPAGDGAAGDALRSAAMPAALLATVREEGGRVLAAGGLWRAEVEAFAARIGADPADMLAGPAPRAHEAIAAAAADAPGLRMQADLCKYLAEADAQGCGPLARAAIAAGVPLDGLADLHELALVKALLVHYLAGTGRDLERLGGLSLAQARTRFAAIDTQLQETEAARILAERIATDVAPAGTNSGPRGSWTELALIRHEIGKKTKHIPIRDLLKRAGGAVAALKPVWMMSPTSAAQYIQPGSNQFDIVVIDEASQMRPEFAVSSVARGSQLVVVGDSNQLPPTDFFTIAQSGEAADDEEDFSIDTESILDLANEKLPHKRRLAWHYRSEHESLIQFSNRRFYDSGLVVFPSPTTDDPLLGVKHVPVGGTYEAQINQDEAQAVIQEATGIMLSRPELTMGIATMNVKQRDLIWAEFERIQAQDAGVRSYVERHAGTIEPFFVKNLENVQGDERDVILISTVYGPDRNGHVFQRFGPLNSKVGHRRLNVLVTRAKQTTRLFTSLKPGDIRPTATSSEGLLATQAYLTYAAGGATFDSDAGGEPDSDFEVFVADRLRGAGYEVVHQVGVEGFRIDLGVRHPSFPLGFVAGIECDGAAYHSGLTVRDRDKIRQAVLEKLGWNIYRIWSTDWFADADAETRRMLAALEGWRAAAEAGYEARRQSGAFDGENPDAGAAASPPPPVATTPAVPAPAPVPAPTPAATPAPAAAEAPRGRPHRVDDIDFYETMRGTFFEVWPDGIAGGEVEVLSRASVAPRLYADGARVQRSQYRGTVLATGASFIGEDLYAAVRRVAREERAARATAAPA